MKAAIDRNLRVLVADHIAPMRRIVRDLLSDLGCTGVAEAADGREAWTLLQAADFDLVITDWAMPGMTGLELLRLIRSDARLGRLPVLMVTAEAQREQIVAAARAGVSGYIIKPFTAQILRQRIDRILQRVGEVA